MDLLNLDDTVYLPYLGLAESLVLRLLPIRRINNLHFFNSVSGRGRTRDTAKTRPSFPLI
jgi:hypothetical protein